MYHLFIKILIYLLIILYITLAFNQEKSTSDLMEKHSKCFISHNSFFPRILKTNATSKLKNSKVYHPPRKKNGTKRASDWVCIKRGQIVDSIFHSHFSHDDTQPYFGKLRINITFFPGRGSEKRSETTRGGNGYDKIEMY